MPAQFDDDATQILNVRSPAFQYSELKKESFLMPPPNIPQNLKNKQMSFGPPIIKNEVSEIDQAHEMDDAT